MQEKEGLFIVFEGIDGAGTSTQVHELAKHIEELDKYQDTLKTHEPWKNSEIKKRLKEDKDAYSHPEELAELFITDRAEHTKLLIKPNLKAGVIVTDDRYIMSTCDYQWCQGVLLEELIDMHKGRGILIPDLTFYVEISRGVAQERLRNRKAVPEKFEKDPDFIDKLIKGYEALTNMSKINPSIFGRVETINGDQSIEAVAQEIQKFFDPLYLSWQKGEYISQSQKANSFNV